MNILNVGEMMVCVDVSVWQCCVWECAVCLSVVLCCVVLYLSVVCRLSDCSVVLYSCAVPAMPRGDPLGFMG